MSEIKVRYSSVDSYRKTAKFKTLKGAQKFAQDWVGKHPEIGSTYAVSSDGIGKVTVEGASLAELFPERPDHDPESGPVGDGEREERINDAWASRHYND